MADGANDIIYKSVGAESAMTAFVCYHPNSGENAALAHPIGSVSDVRTKHEKAGID